jgi:hypothetical protein
MPSVQCHPKSNGGRMGEWASGRVRGRVGAWACVELERWRGPMARGAGKLREDGGWPPGDQRRQGGDAGWVAGRG